MVLMHIEARTGRQISDLFDLMVGTSTGGILALGLSVEDESGKALFTAQQLVKLYEEHGGDIFEQSLWRKVRSVGGILEEAYSHEASCEYASSSIPPTERTLRQRDCSKMSPPCSS